MLCRQAAYCSTIALVFSFPIGTEAQVTQLAKLNASDAGPTQSFGFSTGLSGIYAIAGAPSQQNTTGAAYVFVRNGANWSQQAKLTAADSIPGDAFGQSVAISGDTAVIGAVGDDNITGSAYVFRRNGSTWKREDKLVAEDGRPADAFGQYVSVDGDYALIGSRQDDDENFGDAGSAYIFRRDGIYWSQQAKLLPHDPGTQEYFGYAVSISGPNAIVGSPAAVGPAAYVFVREGTTWTQQWKFDSPSGIADDFGVAVDIDGDYALVGAGKTTLAAYVYHRVGMMWELQGTLTAPDGAAVFGTAVALDGNFAVVGARGDDDDGTDSGAAYLFRRNGTDWSFLHKLKATDASPNDFFGISVGMDRHRAIVGAYADTNFGTGEEQCGTDCGSAYVFAVRSALLGDFNDNGIVDTADYTVWRDTLGSTTNLMADGDLSGTIDAGDYEVWKSHFGDTVASSLMNSAVPEPSAIGMFVVGILLSSKSRRVALK